MTKTTKDDFEYWLADMDDALDRFLATFPDETRTKLDFSKESLDALEAWILQKYDSNQKMLEPSESQTLDGIARYIGETFRKAIDGHWEIRFDDPKYVFYGLPQLAGFSQRSTPESPLTLATAAAERRTGTYLSTILKSLMRRYLHKA